MDYFKTILERCHAEHKRHLHRAQIESNRLTVTQATAISELVISTAFVSRNVVKTSPLLSHSQAPGLSTQNLHHYWTEHVGWAQNLHHFWTEPVSSKLASLLDRACRLKTCITAGPSMWTSDLHHYWTEPVDSRSASLLDRACGLRSPGLHHYWTGPVDSRSASLLD